MKVRTRENGNIIDAPDEQAREIIKAGLWFAADDKPTQASAEQKQTKQPRATRRKPQ